MKGEQFFVFSLAALAGGKQQRMHFLRGISPHARLVIPERAQRFDRL